MRSRARPAVDASCEIVIDRSFYKGQSACVGRPRQFDEEQALDRAMLVFWQRGFAGTSMADLIEATGMQRQSMYNTFGDKQELFARALKRYAERFAELTRPLRSPSAGLPELRQHVLDVLVFQRDAQCGVCMVVKSAFDQQVQEPAIAQVVQAAAQSTRTLFGQVLRQAREAGQVRSDVDPEQAAGFLFSLFNGLSSFAQTGASKQQVLRTLDFALDTLRARKLRPRSK